jgi:16S rRNA (cytosine967-C5)-methyltransferase
VVRQGGRLVYSTCSTEPEENEQVVSAVLAVLPGFERASADVVRSGLPPEARGLVSPSGAFETVPWRDGLEGFFGVVLVRSR